MPGFRKGKIPQGIIKKRYGKLIKIDEINKLLNENVYKYIEDSKVNIIGGPIPLSNDTQNWDNASDYTFKYKLGLCPEINLSKNIKKTINYYKINVGKPLIDNYIKMIASDLNDNNDILLNPYEPPLRNDNIFLNSGLKPPGIPIKEWVTKVSEVYANAGARQKKYGGGSVSRPARNY